MRQMRYGRILTMSELLTIGIGQGTANPRNCASGGENRVTP
jgi:hypothetical protein